MALNTEKPAVIPTTNTLAAIPHDITRREIRLGQNVLLALDSPPLLGETRDIVLRLRCVRTGDEQLAVDAEITHYAAMKIVTAWELGKPKPSNDDQGALLDADGYPIDDPDDGE